VRCPTCGHELECGELAVALETNVAIRGGIAVKLRPTEAEILYALAHAPHGYLRKGRIRSAVWGWGAGEVEDSTLHVWIWHLKRAIAPLNLDIYHAAGMRGSRGEGGYGLRERGS